MEIFKNNDKVIFQHSRKEHHCTLEIERRFILIFLEIHIKCDLLSLRKSNVFSNVFANVILCTLYTYCLFIIHDNFQKKTNIYTN